MLAADNPHRRDRHRLGAGPRILHRVVSGADTGNLRVDSGGYVHIALILNLGSRPRCAQRSHFRLSVVLGLGSAPFGKLCSCADRTNAIRGWSSAAGGYCNLGGSAGGIPQQCRNGALAGRIVCAGGCRPPVISASHKRGARTHSRGPLHFSRDGSPAANLALAWLTLPPTILVGLYFVGTLVSTYAYYMKPHWGAAMLFTWTAMTFGLIAATWRMRRVLPGIALAGSIVLPLCFAVLKFAPTRGALMRARSARSRCYAITLTLSHL